MSNNDKFCERSRHLENADLLARVKTQLREGLRSILGAAVYLTFAANNCEMGKAAVIAQDTLETAVAAPADLIDKDDFFDVFIAGKFSYDDNVYRLSPGVTNLETLIWDRTSSESSRSYRLDITRPRWTVEQWQADGYC